MSLLVSFDLTLETGDCDSSCSDIGECGAIVVIGWSMDVGVLRPVCKTLIRKSHRFTNRIIA